MVLSKKTPSITKLLFALGIPTVIFQSVLLKHVHEAETLLHNKEEALLRQPVAAAIPKVMQISHATSSDRYPDEYSAVRDYLKANSQTTNVNLLSFGSSYGNEAISLSTLYFNETTGFHNVSIQGFDIDTDTIEKARSDVSSHNKEHVGGAVALPIQFYDGRTTPLDIHGMYNAIFANSVFCDATSDPYTVQAVINHFPFQDFESNLLTLDSVLKEGGLLAMVSTSYKFEDSSLAKRYEVIAQCLGGHVPYVDLENMKFVMNDPKEKKDCVWKKIRSA